MTTSVVTSFFYLEDHRPAFSVLGSVRLYGCLCEAWVRFCGIPKKYAKRLAGTITGLCAGLSAHGPVAVRFREGRNRRFGFEPNKLNRFG
jgi:hypothetical protein